jgi:riboflavin synthase
VFTGIIRHKGVLAERRDNAVRIACPELRPRLGSGDSVAVNGVCLTAARFSTDGTSFEADLLAETLARTTLGGLREGSVLNLEPAMRTGDPLGGHWVLGHVDGTAELLAVTPRGKDEYQLEFSLPEWLARCVIDHGSVALDGISFTLQEIRPASFTIGVIPVTWHSTNLKDIEPGCRVNIEGDQLVKTVRKVLTGLLPAILADRGQTVSQAASD